MEIIYEWVVSSMMTKPTEGTLIDVVSAVNYQRIGKTLYNENEIVGVVINTYLCPTPEGDFTPYADLTYQEVCTWLDNGLDVVKIDESIAQQIDLIINPPIVQLPNPWQTQ